MEQNSNTHINKHQSTYDIIAQPHPVDNRNSKQQYCIENQINNQKYHSNFQQRNTDLCPSSINQLHSHGQSNQHQLNQKVFHNQTIDTKQIQFRNTNQFSNKLHKNTSFVCLSCTKKYSGQFKRSFNCFHYFCSFCMEDFYLQTIQKGVKFTCPILNCLNSSNTGPSQSLRIEKMKKSIQKSKFSKQAEFQNNLQYRKKELQLKQARKSTRNSQMFVQRQHSLQKLRPSDKNSGGSYVSFDNKCKICDKLLSIKPQLQRGFCECGLSFCCICRELWQQNIHVCRTQKIQIERIKEQQIEKKEQKKAQFNTLKCTFYGFIWIVLLLVFFFPKFIIGAILTLLISFLAGFTYFACVFVCNQDRVYKKVLLIIFYPFAILVGIGVALINFYSLFYQHETKLFKKVTYCLIQH